MANRVTEICNRVIEICNRVTESSRKHRVPATSISCALQYIGSILIQSLGSDPD